MGAKGVGGGGVACAGRLGKSHCRKTGAAAGRVWERGQEQPPPPCRRARERAERCPQSRVPAARRGPASPARGRGCTCHRTGLCRSCRGPYGRGLPALAPCPALQVHPRPRRRRTEPGLQGLLLGTMNEVLHPGQFGYRLWERHARLWLIPCTGQPRWQCHRPGTCLANWPGWLSRGRNGARLGVLCFWHWGLSAASPASAGSPGACGVPAVTGAGWGTRCPRSSQGTGCSCERRGTRVCRNVMCRTRCQWFIQKVPSLPQGLGPSASRVAASSGARLLASAHGQSPGSARKHPGTQRPAPSRLAATFPSQGASRLLPRALEVPLWHGPRCHPRERRSLALSRGPELPTRARHPLPAPQRAQPAPERRRRYGFSSPSQGGPGQTQFHGEGSEGMMPTPGMSPPSGTRWPALGNCSHMPGPGRGAGAEPPSPTPPCVRPDAAGMGSGGCGIPQPRAVRTDGQQPRPGPINGELHINSLVCPIFPVRSLPPAPGGQEHGRSTLPQPCRVLY